MTRRAPLLALLATCLGAGCTDVFSLATTAQAPNDLATGGVHAPPPDLFFIPGPVLTDGGIAVGGGHDGGMLLPSSCALLPCSPSVDEGNVTFASGTLTGCHAFDTLTLTGTVRFDTFTACALSIEVAGTLDGNGGGAPERMGPGAGYICGSGGGHGGAGADPAECGPGKAYGDVTHPRETGSGGGGFGAGTGGGQIELAAGAVMLDGLIRASGTDGRGASAGGGSGGSVLIAADVVMGAGTIESRGGRGFGLGGGGGGGGRVAVLKTMGVHVPVDVAGGPSSTGPDGAAGTVTQP